MVSPVIPLSNMTLWSGRRRKTILDNKENDKGLYIIVRSIRFNKNDSESLCMYKISQSMHIVGYGSER